MFRPEITDDGRRTLFIVIEPVVNYSKMSLESFAPDASLAALISSLAISTEVRRARPEHNPAHCLACCVVIVQLTSIRIPARAV